MRADWPGQRWPTPYGSAAATAAAYARARRVAPREPASAAGLPCGGPPAQTCTSPVPTRCTSPVPARRLCGRCQLSQQTGGCRSCCFESRRQAPLGWWQTFGTSLSASAASQLVRVGRGGTSPQTQCPPPWTGRSEAARVPADQGTPLLRRRDARPGRVPVGAVGAGAAAAAPGGAALGSGHGGT